MPNKEERRKQQQARKRKEHEHAPQPDSAVKETNQSQQEEDHAENRASKRQDNKKEAKQPMRLRRRSGRPTIRQRLKNRLRAWVNWLRKHEQSLGIWLPVILTAVVAFATTAYTVVSFYQWRAMEKSLRVSQRAYVAVHSLQPDWKTGQIAVVIENIGKVPAEDVKIIDVDTYREVEDKVYRSERQVFGYGHNKLFPGNFKTQIVVPLQGFTQQDTDMISAGKERIIIVGTIQYGDGFSNTDTTPLGYRYFPPPADRWEEIPTSTKAEIEAENERRKNQK